VLASLGSVTSTGSQGGISSPWSQAAVRPENTASDGSLRLNPVSWTSGSTPCCTHRSSKSARPAPTQPV